MAYNKNINVNQGNIVVISGSQIQTTGSLFGSNISGTTAQFTTITGSTVTGSTAQFTNLTASGDIFFQRSSNNVLLTVTGSGNFANYIFGSNSGLNSLGTNLFGHRNISIGYNTLLSNISGVYNIAIGHTALQNSNGNENIALGALSLQSNISGNRNIGIGVNALGANTTGLSNIAVGFNSLRQNTIGSNNISLGASALSSNIDGIYNVALGESNLGNNISGSYNFAAGYLSQLSNVIGDYNIAIGRESSRYNVSGNQNIAIGSRAIWSNVNGSNNIGIGQDTGLLLSTGSNNLFLGNYAGQSETSLSDTVIIGVKNNTERLRIDSTGNMAIGRTTANARLHVSGSAIIDQNLTVTGSTILSTISGTTAQFTTITGSTILGNFVAINTSSNNTHRLLINQSSAGNNGLRVYGPGVPGSTIDIYGDSGNIAKIETPVELFLGNPTSVAENITIKAGRYLVLTSHDNANLGGAIFAAGTTEVMRIIGNNSSSPTENYSVIISGTTNSNTQGRLRFTNTGSATFPLITPLNDKNNGIYFPDADTFAVSTNGTERFRITGSGDITVENISGTTAQFTTVTGSYSGSGAGLYNLTASGISNFTNDVRNQFSAGTNVTIVGGVISAAGATGSGSPGGVDTNIQFNKAGNFSGSNLLTYNYTTNILSGTTAQFTLITGSNITGSNAFFNNITTNYLTGSSINITGTISGSSTQSIIKSDQGISFRTRDSGTGSFTERMFISTNDTINIYSSLNTTSLTASAITANVVTASVLLTGSTAQFTIVTGSTVTGSTARFGTYVAGNGSVSAAAYGFGSDTGMYLATLNVPAFSTNGVEAIRLVNQVSGPQLQLSSIGGVAGAPTLTWNGDNNTGIFRDVANQIGFSTNTIERFRITNTYISASVPITGSYSGSGTGLYNLTASGISNFTNDVRAQFSAGTNVTIVGGVISAAGATGSGSPGGVDTNIQFNSGSTFSGSSNLIYNYTTNTLSGTTAQFTQVTASRLMISSSVFGDSPSNPTINFAPDPDTGIFWQASGQFSFANNGTRTFAFDNGGMAANGGGGIYLLPTFGNTAAAPAYTFNGDADTGMYRPAANNIAFTTSGSQRLLITDTVITASLPITGTNAEFTQVSGAFLVASTGGTVSAPSITTTGDSNTGIFFPGADIIGITRGGNEIMRLGANVGINNNSPTQAKLSIVGDLAISGTTNTTLALKNVLDTDTGLYFPNNNNQIAFATSGTQRLLIDDLNVSLAGNLIVTGTSNFSTINTTNLNVSNIANITSSIIGYNSDGYSYGNVTINSSGSNQGTLVLLGQDTNDVSINYDGDYKVGVDFSDGNKFKISYGNPTAIGFGIIGGTAVLGTNDILILDKTVSGSVGIGTTGVLTERLTVSGNIKATGTGIVSGTTAQFTSITGSHSGSGNGLYNITASGISNFTNDVRAQFSAGTNVTIVGGVISAAGGSSTYGQISASFSRSVHSVTSFVTDAGVSLSSNIVTTIALSSSRDLDEMEFAPVVVAVGGITSGVGFNIIAVSLDGDADGTYLINYTRN